MLCKALITCALTSFFPEKGGSNSAFAGAIGTALLKRFRIIIDYERQRVTLEGADASAP
jgi:hypothetical protein